MKHFIAIFAVMLLLFSFAACQQKQTEYATTSAPSTVVNNIYITDDGIFTDIENAQTDVITPTVAQPAQTEPITNETIVQTTELTTLPLSQYTAQMVLDEITAAVNLAKMQKNFSANLLQQVEIKLTDCTLSWAVSVINRAIGVFNGPHEAAYAFVDGECPDPKEDFKTTATPMSAIPPSDRLFALEADGVIDYRAWEENGEYVYTVTLPFEFTDAQTLVPYYHAQAMDYLDLADFDFGIGEITNAECFYPGATVTVYTDQNGNLLKYEQTIPMYGSGTGKLGIELSASFEGSMYECWIFEW